MSNIHVVEQVHQLFEKLLSGEEKVGIFAGNDIRTTFSFAQKIPEVKELIKIGKPSAYLLMSEFSSDELDEKYKTHQDRDAVLTCIVYIIEQTKFHPSIPVLLDFLKRHWQNPKKFFYSTAATNQVLRHLTGLKDPPKPLTSEQEIVYTILFTELWLKEVEKGSDIRLELASLSTLLFPADL